MTSRSKPRDPGAEGGQGEEKQQESLEGRLRRLEEILGQLEADEVELERALALFEEGVGLVRDAESVLSRTALRVEELLQGGRTEPFQQDEDEGEGRDA